MSTQPSRSFPLARRHGALARWGGALVVALVGLQVLLSSGFGGSEIQAAPAGDDVKIVATGRCGMPSDPIGWRVVRDTAYAEGDALYRERALGFAIADRGGIVLMDEGGQATEIVEDGAGFIPEAAIQAHVSLSGRPTPYLRIGLVPPVDVAHTAGSDLIYGGTGDRAPLGVRELILVRHRLVQGAAFKLADFGFPSLVVVTAGAVEVATGASAHALGASEAREFRGEPTVTATAPGETVVYVAIVGGEVGGTAADGSSPGTGTIALQIFRCPPGIGEADLPAAQDVCELDFGAIELVLADAGWNAPLGLDHTVTLQHAIAWVGLPFGEHLVAFSPPDAAVIMSATDADALGQWQANTAKAYPVKLTPANPEVLLQVYVFF